MLIPWCLRDRIRGLFPRFSGNGFASAGIVALAASGTLGTGITLAASPGAAAAVQAAATAPAPLAVAVTQLPSLPGHVRVHDGDTLSGISQSTCATAADWSGFYADNRDKLTSPDLIEAGQLLRVSCTDPGYTPPAPPPPPVQPHVQAPVQEAAAPSTSGTGSSLAAADVRPPAQQGSGQFTTAGIESLWESAGGPAWAAPHAAEIAYCESGYNPDAYNPSGATGLWQILGSVVPGDLTNPTVNAENAVAKFKASGDTFAQWVCQ